MKRKDLEDIKKAAALGKIRLVYEGLEYNVEQIETELHKREGQEIHLTICKPIIVFLKGKLEIRKKPDELHGNVFCIRDGYTFFSFKPKHIMYGLISKENPSHYSLHLNLTNT